MSTEVVGERYIISERFISARELYGTAAEAGGARPPRLGIPLKVMYALDHGKAERELGWHPSPIHDSIRDAVAFYRGR